MEGDGIKSHPRLVSVIRRHLSVVGFTWLVFQAGVLAVSPLASCCAAASQSAAVEDDDCCAGLAPGQICPLHKHRHSSPTPSHQDSATAHHDRTEGACGIRGECGTLDPALLSLSFGLGVVDSPAALVVAPMSYPVPAFAACALDCAPSLDPPPPR